MNNFFNKEISVKMFMVSFVILNMLYIIPFILSPYLFMDDTVRIVVGNPDWGWQGRPLADFMMYLLSSDNNKIVNLFPFPLLLTLLFYFYTIYYIVKHHLNSLKIYYLFSFLLILGSPLFVHNLLYKYDSAPMILGVSISLLAFFYQSKNKYIDIFVPVLLLIMTLSLYQPCFNIFLTLLVGNYLIKLKKDINYIKYFIVYIFSLVAYIILVSIIMGLKSNRSHMLNLFDINSLYIMLNKLSFFIKELFLNLPLLIVIPCILLTCLFIINTILNIKQESTIIKKYYIALSPILIFLSLWGGLIIIKEPLIQPREFINFGILLFIVSFYLIDKYKNISVYLTLILLLGCFSFAYQSINTLKEQKEFEKIILTNVFTNITENPEIFNSYKIYINGKLPKSLVLKNNESNSQIIKRFIEPADKWVIRYTLIKMGIDNIQDGFSDDNKEQLKIIKNIKPIIETKFYSIYKVNNSSIIYFEIKKGVSKDSLKRQ